MKALARAYRWKRLLESGRYGSLAELAAAEKIERSFLGKTLLAPDIVEAILDGRQPEEMSLAALMGPFPLAWAEQATAPRSLPQSSPARRPRDPAPWCRDALGPAEESTSGGIP